jgi:hypothetical protein
MRFSSFPFVLHVLRILFSTPLSSKYTWRRLQITLLLVMRFFHPLVASLLFGPDIILSTLFSNAFSVSLFLNVRDQVSHTCRTTGKIISIVLKMALLSRRKISAELVYKTELCNNYTRILSRQQSTIMLMSMLIWPAMHSSLSFSHSCYDCSSSCLVSDLGFMYKLAIHGHFTYLRFEVFTAVTMKNGVF